MPKLKRTPTAEGLGKDKELGKDEDPPGGHAREAGWAFAAAPFRD